MRHPVVLLLALLGGCAAPSPSTSRPCDPPEEPAVRELGTSVRGAPLRCEVLGSGPERVLFLASIHGSEPAGTPLLRRLIAELAARPELLEGRTALVVAVCNPDGLADGSRGNARGVDLNRNFPADNFHGRARHGDEPLGEPESRALFELIEAERPARILTVHQPLACVDWDGPGAALAAALAEVGPLPARRLGGRPGSLGSWAGEALEVPVITLELRRGDERLEGDDLWARYGALLLRFLAG